MGYEGPGNSCTDVDECASVALNECSPLAMCSNTMGSYSCACSSGYEGSGVTCTDVDECADGTGRCELGEICVNVLGAPFSCSCAPGFARPTPDAACASNCGNGIRGAGEECDDANVIAADGCSAVCEVEPGFACFEPDLTVSTCSETCGDGLIDVTAGEQCDDAAANSDTLVDACRTRCLRAFCGDTIIDTGEECDDGDLNSDVNTGACRTTCKTAFCGDGVIDEGEMCDFGTGEPAATPDACTSAERCAEMTDAGVPDAGVALDGSVLVGDGSIDAAITPAPIDDGGCSCRTTGSKTRGNSLAALLALGLGLMVARRRRRR